MPLLLELLDEDEEVVELLDVVLEVVLEVVELDELLLELVVPEQAQGLWASMTHCESHMVLQQYESMAQTEATHAEHDDWSAPPEAQGAWAQVPPDELELDELVDVVVDELLDVVDVLELEELDEPPQVLGLGGAWQKFVSLLHHQPPQQPLAWQGMFALVQPVHPAITLGPRRAPQTCPPLELVLVVELVVLVLVLDVDPELDVDVVPPHTLVFGTHAASCFPSASGTGVHVRSAVQIMVPPQIGAQYSSPPNWAHFQPI
jgi:hypothetical protein